MNITMNDEYTGRNLESMVKAAMKKFQKAHTDKDLAAMFHDAMMTKTDCSESKLETLSGQVICCDVDAFPYGSEKPGVTFFEVNMVIYNWSKIAKVRFYVDSDDNIELENDHGTPIYEFRVYTENC